METKTNKTKALVTTTINTSVEKVWKAWTTPDLILKWFGSDPGGTGIEAKLDVQPGGYFEVTFKDSDGSEHTCYGNYNVVEKFKTLTFSWTWKTEPDNESFVSLEFLTTSDGTVINLEHADLWAESEHDCQMGWQGAFSKLKSLLET